MEKLNFPNGKVLIKNKENKPYIFDRIRKKWLQYTPEEWVRVHCVEYLIETEGYPASWLLIEKEINVFETKKRIDIVVVDPKGGNRLLVECKAPSVSITQTTFDQIARYNLNIQSHYLMVSNGIDHYFCQMDYKQKRYHFIQELPNFESR